MGVMGVATVLLLLLAVVAATVMATAAATPEAAVEAAAMAAVAPLIFFIVSLSEYEWQQPSCVCILFITL